MKGHVAVQTPMEGECGAVTDAVDEGDGGPVYRDGQGLEVGVGYIAVIDSEVLHAVLTGRYGHDAVALEVNSEIGRRQRSERRTVRLPCGLVYEFSVKASEDT